MDVSTQWTLSPAVQALVMAKSKASRLGFALMLLFYRCTNTQHQPVMEALKVLQNNPKRRGATYPKEVQPPLKGVVSSALDAAGGRNG